MGRLAEDALGRTPPNDHRLAHTVSSLWRPRRRNTPATSEHIDAPYAQSTRWNACDPRVPGVLHHIEILEAGVSYEGQPYGSLSEGARLITGTRWNGPKFFGLRLEARA